MKQPQLTRQQYRILTTLACGVSASEAADQLGLKLSELGRELTTIREVLGVTSTAEALRAAGRARTVE